MTAKRRNRLLRGCPVSTGRGLEFGPLTQPVVRKDEGTVLYVDHTDTETLRKKAANDPALDAMAVVEVDIVLEQGPLVGLCRPFGPFDYAVASHVFEHLANPVGWLRDVAALLVPGGVIALAIPDRRYTFDFFRQETTVEQLLSYDRLGLFKPNLEQLSDHFYNVRRVDTSSAWTTPPRLENAPRYHDDEQVGRILARATGGKHVDCHCTVWSSEGFGRIIPEAIRQHDIPLSVVALEEAQPGTNEFIVHLKHQVRF
jgi:SAM-dependent methyltransferase